MHRSDVFTVHQSHSSYDISKTIAFSRQNVLVEQTQLRASYCRRGLVYGVDTVTQNSGVVYSDYFVLNIHYRCQVRSEKRVFHNFEYF